MPDLRPMNFGEILDGSLVIYRRHFGLFLKLALAALSLPVVLLVYFGFRFIAEVQARPSAFLPLVPVGIFYYVASLVLTAGTVRIISETYLGRVPRFQDAISLGMSKIWPLIAVGLGKGIVLMLIVLVAGALAAVAGGLLGAGGSGALAVAALVVAGGWFVAFVACGYGVTTPVVVLEELRSSFDAFGRSWELTRGSKRKVFGLAAVAFLLCNLIPSQVFQLLAAAFMSSSPAVGVAMTVVSFVLPLILAPVFASVITLMYYDLRVRREAFDLRVLGKQLGII
jgi:hypothetical protein